METAAICEVEKYDNLLFELLFGENQIVLIQFDDYCKYDERLDFKEQIRNILKKGIVKILDDRIIHTESALIWKLEIKRL